MQNEPEKTTANYNELRSAYAPVPLPPGVIEIQSDPSNQEYWQGIIKTGVELVSNKVNEILGSTNKLTAERLVFPRIIIADTDSEHPKWAGYFSSYKNEITLITDKIAIDTRSRTKVIIHELVHFLSHNGRDDSEHLDDSAPIAQDNNVGFHRDFGIDIREGAKGEVTGDYFLSFNEAVTEQLAIDILPGVHETYSDYRGLLNKVIDDAVSSKLGAKREDGTFVSWSREQFKNYIYSCFFRGDITGLTNLLKITYKEYDISEQQFGLMTNQDDLPSIIKEKLIHDEPGSPPPAPTKVLALLQQRLDDKRPEDYTTDIIDPKPGDDGDSGSEYGVEFDIFVKENRITPYSKETIDGIEYDIDSAGLIIFRSDDAALRLSNITMVLNELVVKKANGDVSTSQINEQIDFLLFNTYRMSMLSDGFRDVYIYKHNRLDD